MYEALVSYLESQADGVVGKEYESSAGRIVIYKYIRGYAIKRKNNRINNL